MLYFLVVWHFAPDKIISSKSFYTRLIAKRIFCYSIIHSSLFIMQCTSELVSFLFSVAPILVRAGYPPLGPRSSVPSFWLPWPHWSSTCWTDSWSSPQGQTFSGGANSAPKKRGSKLWGASTKYSSRISYQVNFEKVLLLVHSTVCFFNRWSQTECRVTFDNCSDMEFICCFT